MPPVTPRRMRLPCMGNSVRLPQFSHCASRYAQTRARIWAELRLIVRFLPLPPRGGGSLDWRPTVVRTEGNEHPALARRGAAAGEAARARRTRALGCRARGAASWLGDPGTQRGRAGAQPDRGLRLVARAAERGIAALPRAGGHRAGALRDPQGGGGAGAAALSRGAAHRTSARGPRGAPHFPP